MQIGIAAELEVLLSTSGDYPDTMKGVVNLCPTKHWRMRPISDRFCQPLHSIDFVIRSLPADGHLGALFCHFAVRNGTDRQEPFCHIADFRSRIRSHLFILLHRRSFCRPLEAQTYDGAL